MVVRLDNQVELGENVDVVILRQPGATTKPEGGLAQQAGRKISGGRSRLIASAALAREQAETNIKRRAAEQGHTLAPYPRPRSVMLGAP